MAIPLLPNTFYPVGTRGELNGTKVIVHEIEIFDCSNCVLMSVSCAKYSSTKLSRADRKGVIFKSIYNE